MYNSKKNKSNPSSVTFKFYTKQFTFWQFLRISQYKYTNSYRHETLNNNFPKCHSIHICINYLQNLYDLKCLIW
jgi:hypothetical protein